MKMQTGSFYKIVVISKSDLQTPICKHWYFSCFQCQGSDFAFVFGAFADATTKDEKRFF